MILKFFFRIIKLVIVKKKWRYKNKNNYTSAANVFDIRNVHVGKMSYGPIEVHQWNANNEALIIGNYVSIAEGTKFILGGNHNISTFSTYPFKAIIMKQGNEAWSKGKIVVNDDVWIGMDAIILSGVTIGKGAVIGARSVVTKNVPPYAIVAGNPARIVKYRFNQDIIDKIINIDFDKIDYEFVENNIGNLYEPLDNEIIYNILRDIKD